MINLGDLQGNVRINGMSEAVQGLNSLNGGFDKAMGVLKKFGEAIAIGTIIKKTTDALIDCGKSAAQFETSFAKVSTLLDETQTDFGKYQQSIVEASNATGVSATDLAEATYQAISAGQSAENAVDFVVQMNKLATGGFTDTTKAVDIVTTALNAYGLESSKAGEVCDLLIQTQNKGKTSVDELASSMGKIIPSANANNVALNQLCSGYAILTANGISTAEATTYFNSMLNELGKGGTKVDGILREVAGSSFSELMASGKSVGDVLQILKDKADADGVSFSDLWSSSEAGKSALVLLGDGASKFNDMLVTMGDSTGATEEAFSKMADTTEFKMQKLKTNIDNIKIAIGDALLPVVSDIIDYVMTNVPLAVESIKGFIESNNIIEKTKQVCEALTPILAGVLGGFIAFKTITTVQSVFTSITGAITLLTGAMASAGGASALLTTAIGAIASPITIAVVAIGGLIAILVSLYQNNEEVRKIMDDCWKAIKELISSTCKVIADVIKSFTNTVKDIWKTHGGNIKEVAKAIWDAITDVIKIAINLIKDVFNVFSKAFQGDWKGCWDAVKNLVSDIWKAIGTLIKDALNIIVTTVVNIGVSLAKAGKDVFTALLNAIKQVWQTITSWLKSAINDPVNTVKGIGSAMKNAGASIFNSLLGGIKSVWSGIQSFVSDKVNWIKDKLAFWDSSSSKMNGSHRTGLGTVPFDGYVAQLHKGEMVLTQAEADRYRKQEQVTTQTKQVTFSPIFNITNVSNAKEVSRQIQSDLTKYNRALGLA